MKEKEQSMDIEDEMKKTLVELSGKRTPKASHAVVTPRVEHDPDQYDFAVLGEKIADSLVQTAQEQANRANVMLEQARAMAEEMREKIAAKNAELDEMNRQLKAFGERVLEVHHSLMRSEVTR